MSVDESLRYLEWRKAQYPLAHELLALWSDRSGQTVLDYGCGPGDDLVGFLVHGRAAQIIGVDVSALALGLARDRLLLHGMEGRFRLDLVSDAELAIDQPDGSVDSVICNGVLHHVSHPERVLAELWRVLRPGGEARVMVYNRDSLWWHLYVPWHLQVEQRVDFGLSQDEAFRRSTDGPDCPISRAYSPGAFAAMAEGAGFSVTWMGGYFNGPELAAWRVRGVGGHPGLDEEHRAFLASLVVDADGYPRYRGYYAGAGGVFRMIRE